MNYIPSGIVYLSPPCEALMITPCLFLSDATEITKFLDGAEPFGIFPRIFKNDSRDINMHKAVHTSILSCHSQIYVRYI